MPSWDIYGVTRANALGTRNVADQVITDLHCEDELFDVGKQPTYHARNAPVDGDDDLHLEGADELAEVRGHGKPAEEPAPELRCPDDDVLEQQALRGCAPRREDAREGVQVRRVLRYVPEDIREDLRRKRRGHDGRGDDRALLD
jgi:hypothetical protein